jgi:hypothetical protein
MKSKTSAKENKYVDNQQDKKSTRQKAPVQKKPAESTVFKELAEDGHEDFYNYLDWLGLGKSHNLLILTSSHHYYFEVEDLKNIKTVVNLNKLNSIKNVNEFLGAIYSVLPDKCYFIGSFTDNKSQNVFMPVKKSAYRTDEQGSAPKTETSTLNSFLNILYGLIDSKTNKSLSKKNVGFMLEDTGFKIVDITEFNGLTYFCTQKDKPSVE